MASGITPKSVEKPYVGPKPFETSQAHLFFGRELEADELLSLVITERLVLFYAQSGSGKSSLVNTRLLPGLRQRGFAVLPVGRVSGKTDAACAGNIFIQNLLLSLKRVKTDLAAPECLRLAEYLAELTQADMRAFSSADGEGPAQFSDAAIQPLALVIDQFEEIFTTHPEAWNQRGDFFDQLREAMAADPYLWVVLVMREDFIAELDPYTPRLPNKLRARYYMQRMGVEAAAEAVKRPVAEIMPFEDGAADQLVKHLRLVRAGKDNQDNPVFIEGEFVEPVQLQVVCLQLWEQLHMDPAASVEKKSISQEDLDRLSTNGNLAEFVSSALGKFYEQAIASVLEALSTNVGAAPAPTVTEREIRNWFSNKLITESETRGLVFQGEENTGTLPNAAVRLLENQFIIRSDTRADGTKWYELIHDRFVAPILQANRAWEAAHPLPPEPGFAETVKWLTSGRDPRYLLDGQTLKDAAAANELNPTKYIEADRDLIEASLDAVANKKAVRQRFMGLLIFLALVAAFAVTLFTIENNRQAESQKAELLSNQIGLSAMSNAKDPDKALLLSIAAVRISPTWFARLFFNSKFLQSRPSYGPDVTSQKVIGAPARVAHMIFSPDSRFLAGIGVSGEFKDRLFVWEIGASKDKNNLDQVSQKILEFNFDPTALIIPQDIQTIPDLQTLVFSPKAKYLVLADSTNHLWIWDFQVLSSNSRREITLDRAGMKILSMAVDPGESYLAVGFDSGELVIVDLNNLKTWSSRSFLSSVSVLAWAQHSDSPLLTVGIDRQMIMTYHPLADPQAEDEQIIKQSPAIYKQITWSNDGHDLFILEASGFLKKISLPSGKEVSFGVSSIASGMQLSPDGQSMIIWTALPGVDFLGKSFLVDTQSMTISGFFPDPRMGESGSTLMAITFNQREGPPILTFNQMRINTIVNQEVPYQIFAWPQPPAINLAVFPYKDFSRGVESIITGPDGKLAYLYRAEEDLFRVMSESGEMISENYWASSNQPRLFLVDGTLGILDIKEEWKDDHKKTLSELRLVAAAGTNQPLRPFIKVEGIVNAAAVDQAGKWLAVVRCNSEVAALNCKQYVELWDLNLGKPNKRWIKAIAEDKSRVLSAIFKPDGTMLILGHKDGYLTFIDLSDANQSPKIRYEGELFGSSISNEWLAVSPDGTLLVSIGSESKLGLWDLVSKKSMGEVPGPEEITNYKGVVFLDKKLYTVTDTGLLISWDIDFNSWLERACKMAGRDLTEEEREAYLGEGNTIAVCPDQKK